MQEWVGLHELHEAKQEKWRKTDPTEIDKSDRLIDARC